jgi:RimJ/RimL family protein N-acetyltransferase
MTPAAETERLRLRRLSAADAPFLVELLNQRSWIDFIGDRGVRTLAQASTYLTERIDSQFEKFGFGMWGAQLRHEPRPIGLVGLVKRDFLSHPDLGFALLDRYAGQGYAFEAASAVLSIAAALGHKRLLAITLPENRRSINLLERLGFALDATEPQPDGGERASRTLLFARGVPPIPQR